MKTVFDWVGIILPWWVKVLMLLSGLVLPLLGLQYLLLDGLFHSTASEQRLKNESVDWILADKLGAKRRRGLSVHTHRMLGIGMMLGSGWVFYDLFLRKGAPTKFSAVWLKKVMPPLLVIIATGITVKNLVLKKL